MAHTSLLGWANSIRITMVNDPGRKLFQEQIQTHGFSFLDDYLDNILSGAKQDTLIELVKTPGRKKAVSRKPKFASKQVPVTNVSLKDRDGDETKENIPPARNLTRDFLSVKTSVDPSQGLSQLPPETFGELSYSQSQGDLSHSCGTTNIGPPELSVIAEDDEGPERSRSSIRVTGSSLRSNKGHVSITLNKATTKDPSPTNPKSQDNRSHYSEPLEDVARPMSASLQDFKHAEENPVIDITVPIHDPVESFSPLPSARKSVLSTLPMLPEPVPLRKSMRTAKEVTISSSTFGTATPGNPGGKRTSWLKKVREANALETIPKKSGSNHPFSMVPAISGTKRKSEEIVDSTQPSKEERQPKAMKQWEDETAPIKAASPLVPEQSDAVENSVERSNSDGMLDMLKKKVQGLEARNDRQSNKASGDAAAALAQARAQAEARIAERNHQEEGSMSRANTDLSDKTPRIQTSPGTTPPEEGDRRFSVSDLFPAEGKVKDKSLAPTKPLAFAVPGPIPENRAASNSESTSTTPPHSPPTQASAFITKPPPVFNKPPPVFVPPVATTRPLPTPPTSKELTFTLPSFSAFSKPTSPTPESLTHKSSHFSNTASAARLIPQLSLKLAQSGNDVDGSGNTEPWVPRTQDAEYSSASRSQHATSVLPNALDEDDSWPIDEKLPLAGHWPFGSHNKEDSMTWSSSSQTQRAEIGGAPEGIQDHEKFEVQAPKGAELDRTDEDMDIEKEDYNTGTETIAKDPELEELILGGRNSIIESGDGHDQTSLASSVSSQNQSLLGYASKTFSSVLGTSKKGKPEMKKAMQLAAAAAKKQQQEDDKKAARLKEMENRRQLAMQRKAEEERTRQQEQERKTKEEVERRKREREEQVEKKPVKMIASSGSFKKEEETTKKRKVEQDRPEKKLDLKKQPLLNKTGSKSASSSKQTGALSSSAAYNSSLSQSVTPSTNKASEKPSKVPSAIPTKGKLKPMQKVTPKAEDDHAQPSQILQTQMAARAKAAMQTEARVASEAIELPEVNSEYSDSEDEERPRTFNPPEWAQSPELRQALEAQSTINPDDVFGAIRPLRMEEMFKARTSRFRARTSSANWSGADRLTVEEEREYARRMGFK